MRIDVTIVPFTNAASGAVLADVDLSNAKAVAFGVAITGWTGTPATGTHFSAFMVSSDGNVVFSNGDVIGTGDITSAITGGILLSRAGVESAAKTTILGNAFLLPGPFKRVQVKDILATATAVSGSVYIWTMVE